MPSTSRCSRRSRAATQSSRRRSIDDFLASARADLQALDDALDGGDADEAGRRAHRIKGAARTVGATAMVALAQQIERDAANEDSAPKLASLTARLHDAFAACQSATASTP